MSVTLSIDGKDVTAREGETILQCALRHDISIPHLCTHPALEAFGACRMCVVEIEGMRGYPASCSTPAEKGMVVRTETAPLQQLRRNILALMMLEHPSACLVCDKRELCERYRPKADKAGRTSGCHTCNNKEVCEVRDLSATLGLAYLPVPPIYREAPLERSEPFIDRDLNLCILCGRCVRICKLQHGQGVIDFVNRGGRARIGQAFGCTLSEAGCTFCGSCVDVCPTGSLADRYAKWQGDQAATTDTTCQFCGAACAIRLGANDRQRAVAAKAINEHVALCVLGRFAIPEFLNGGDRIAVPQVRAGKVLRQTTWDAALARAAETLKPFAGEAFALVCDTTSTIEDRHVFKRFTTEVMKSPHYIELQPDASGVAMAALPPGVKAVFATGALIKPDELEALEALVVQDVYPTAASERADVVLPAAVFAEIEGTIADANGAHRPLRKAADAPGDARPEWRSVSELARALGAAGFEYDSPAAIRAEIGMAEGELWIERAEAPAPALNPRLRRSWYRGHCIEDKVKGLRDLPAATEPASSTASHRSHASHAPAAAETSPVPLAGGFRVAAKREVAPNVHELVIEAPAIARKAQAGQFVIAMVDEKSERVPYTLCDWDAAAGTITLVVLEMGRSSRKLVMLRAGDSLAHVAGPLGVPLEIAKYGAVALLGGCYGVGAVLGVAKAMKAAGNRVVTIVEARSTYAHYFGDRLRAASDEFVQTTIDGSNGVKGHAMDVVGQRLRDGEHFDLVVAVGCPFMMMLSARETEPFAVKTLVALNPIMLDGTGMCGACRVTVGEETKFACVDGPFFDGHKIDWDELWDRRAAYSAEEMHSLARTEGERPRERAHGHAHAHGACSLA